jgi:hypothetical protein
MRFLALLLLVFPLAAQYPLRASSDGRYLVDKNGKAFLYQADTSWPLLFRSKREDAEMFFADRARKGYNTLQVQLLLGGEPEPNADGEWPLGYQNQSHEDLSLPNPAFFQHLDWLLKRAAAHGIQLAIAPVWLDCCEGGWRDKLLRNGLDKTRNFGRYLGRRYMQTKNIVWILGGDGIPGDDLPYLRALAEGIREFDGTHLITAHSGRPHSAAEHKLTVPWLTLNSIDTASPGAGRPRFHTYAAAKRDHEHTPAKPFVLLAPADSGEDVASRHQIREQTWWAMLSGASGYAFVSQEIDLRNKSATPSPNNPSALDLAPLRAILEQYQWWRLRPDFAAQCVGGERGTFSDSADPHAGQDYVVAACDEARGVALAYANRGQRPFGVNAFASARAIWIDPSDGQIKKREGKNAAGADDWLLLLKK